MQLGAVDILQKPVSSQTGRLGTLWQHTLRKRGSAASTARGSDSCNTSSGAGSTAADPTVCTAGDDLVKAILPDLFEADLWDAQTITGTSGEHSSSIDTPETPDISHHLHQDYSSSQSLLSCYPNNFSGSSLSHERMVKAHSVNSALSPVLVPQVRVLCHANAMLCYALVLYQPPQPAVYLRMSLAANLLDFVQGRYLLLSMSLSAEEPGLVQSPSSDSSSRLCSCKDAFLASMDLHSHDQAPEKLPS